MSEARRPGEGIPDQTRIVVLSGLSGSGKTTAMDALEDQSFYCVDNLPPQLIGQVLDLCAKATPPIEKVALAVDAREEPFLRRLPEALAQLRASGEPVAVIFLDCANGVLERRYRETRRVHPLSPTGSVEDGIEAERRLLSEIAGLADLVIDTSALNVHELKATVARQVGGERRHTVVNVVSFGFRYGTPPDVELLFDLRFLPNPHFVEHLRPRSGMDSEVSDHVLKSARGAAFFDRLLDFVCYLLPMYDQEGKAYVTVGVGCTGGRHRSVAISIALGERLRELGRDVNVEHRDMERGQ